MGTKVARDRPRARLLITFVGVLIWLIAACSGTGPSMAPFPGDAGSSPLHSTPAPRLAPHIGQSGCEMDPARRHAGEIMSFLLQVVLGQDGRPETREDWATRGLDFPLNLDAVSREMSVTGGGNILRIMVFDPNILDLSQTLYYYDDRLGFSKDKFNVYPATEFMAIRLLLIKKIAKGEKINLGALLERRRMLFDKERKVGEEDLEAIGLRSEEIDLIRDILQSAPYLFEYLSCPFLVKGLYEAGVLSMDETVRQKLAEANYRDFSCRPEKRPEKTKMVRVAILPSLTKEFLFGTSRAASSPTGFVPSGHLEEMVEVLKEQIIEGAAAWMAQKALEAGFYTASDPLLLSSWSEIVRSKVNFCVQDQRPMVITPRNAAEVIEDVCPDSDFTIILLGKNVYLSLFIDPDKDTYPAVNRMYVDFDDIRFVQTKDRYEPIAEIIYHAMSKNTSGGATS
jgi:hypothetical protein